MDTIRNSLNEAKDVLATFLTSEKNIDAIHEAAKWMIHTIKNGGKIISFGNGGSLCDAMHFAEELSGKFRNYRPALPAIAISDPSYITCVANDYDYSVIFSRYLEAIGKEGDIAFALSTSGNSENVILAARTAREKNMKIIALTGNSGGKLSKLTDIEIRVPFTGYSDRIQEIHGIIIHILIETIEKKLFPIADS